MEFCERMPFTAMPLAKGRQRWVFDLPEADFAPHRKDDEESRWKVLQSTMKRGRPEELQDLAVRWGKELPCLLSKTRCSSSGRNTLHVAAKAGNLPMVKLLMKDWPSLSKTEDDFGLLPLHLAAASCHLEVVEFLSQESPETVHAKSPTEGVSPIHVAGARGSLLVLSYFCHSCPHLLKERTKTGLTVLHLAAIHGNFKKVQFLVDFSPELMMIPDCKGNTAAHLATARNHVTIVQFFIQRCHRFLEVINRAGWTLLHMAACAGHFTLSKLCAERNPELVTMQSFEHRQTRNCNLAGFTPVHIAAFYDHLHILRYLVEHFPSACQVLSRCNWTPMHCAAYLGHWQVLEYLVRTRPQMATAECFLGKTPLHLASRHGHLAATELLLRVPEAITLATDEGHLALHEAALGGHLSVVRLLASQPGMLEEKKTTNQNLTALHLAARGGHLAVVQLLAEAQPQAALATCRLGWTALHLSASYGHVAVTQFLAERWPELVHARTSPQYGSIYACDCWQLSACDGGCSKMGGWLPLHIAAQKGQLAVIKYLVSKWPDWRWRFLGCPRRARLRLDASGLAGEQKAKVTVAQRQSAEWLMGRLATLIEAPTERLVLLFPNGDHLRGPRCSGRKAKLGHILQATR